MLNRIVFSLAVTIALCGVGNSFAQTQDIWKTYTSEECKVNFQYPSSWIVKIKQGTFDTNTTYLIAFYDPSVNLTDYFPAFVLQDCLDVDVLNMMINVVKTYPTYGEKLPISNITDVKSLGLAGEAMIGYLSTMMGAINSLISGYGNSTVDVPQITIVEHTSVKRKLIGGEDAAVFSALFKTKIDNETKSLNIGARQYGVIHNGITYSFSFSNDVAKFDLPENAKIRQRILESIHFTNDITS